jgi:uncharacterized protein YggE
MKTKLFLAVGVILILGLVGLSGCSATGVAAADTQPISVNVNGQQGIVVNGEGRVTVAPDIATLSLGITAQAPKVADAQSKATSAMDKVMAALTAAGIDKKDIQTQFYNITQVINYDRAGSSSSGMAVAPGLPMPITPPPTPTPTITGYQISNMITVKVRAIDKTGAIIDAVAAAGGDLIRVNSVYFSIDQPDKYYTQARTLAVNDAKAKAQSLASLAGVNLGKATFVSENSYAQPIPYPMAMYKSADMAGGAAPSTSISPGQTDVVLNVQVNYAIQ